MQELQQAQFELVDEKDPRCPNCGDDSLDRESVDVGVGFIYGPWGCYSCGWSSDARFDRSQGPAPADAEYPDHILTPTGVAHHKGRIEETLHDRFGIKVDLVEMTDAEVQDLPDI